MLFSYIYFLFVVLRLWLLSALRVVLLLFCYFEVWVFGLLLSWCFVILVWRVMSGLLDFVINLCFVLSAWLLIGVCCFGVLLDAWTVTFGL